MLRIRVYREKAQVLLNRELLLDDVSLTDPDTIELLEPSELRKLEKCTFSDLDHIGVELDELFHLPALHYFSIVPPLKAIEKEPEKKEFTLEYYFECELRDWKNSYSFAEYTQELLRITESRRFPGTQCARCDSSEDHEDSFLLKFSVLDPTVTIANEIDRTFPLVRDICSEAISNFLIRNTTALTTVFDFPEELETPCEQYLIYFVEFLRQLGVYATSRLTHQTGQVLFTVYPSNVPEVESGLKVLEKLRTALELYIRLPSSALEEYESKHHVTQQLLANIHHLRTQLAFREAVVQAEQGMIDRQLFSSDVVRRSLRLSTFGPPLGEEQLLSDLDCLTLDEGKGVKINLPKMYHWLKDFTRK